MNKKTLKALKGSITKWKKIVKSPLANDKGLNNCPLCSEFYDQACENCPVSIAVNEIYCDETPYAGWQNHHKAEHTKEVGLSLGSIRGCKECLRHAKAELAFLESLLPKTKRSGKDRK